MPSWVECENGHTYGRCLDAAREISEYGAPETCSRCGLKRHYFVEHYYPYDRETHKYEVEKVVRLLPPQEAERQGWDPMFFLMRNVKDGHVTVWPYYWGIDSTGRWRNGQFPPLLSIDDLKRVIKTFEV